MPTRYYEKTTQVLSTANGQILKTRYKLSNIVVSISDICLHMTFTLEQDADIDVILENPFTALIEPFTIDDIGIHTKLKGKEVTFKLEFS